MYIAWFWGWGVSFRCFFPVFLSGVSVGDKASVESRRRVVCSPVVESDARRADQLRARIGPIAAHSRLTTFPEYQSCRSPHEILISLSRVRP